jgi:hypothetical protein
MPRYYFHIRNGSDLDEDPEGTELPDINAAHADETSQTVLLVPFSEAIGPIQ